MKNKFGAFGIIATFLLNLVINLQWSIPAWILLALHFWLDIPLFWFVIALLLWIIPTTAFGLFVGIAAATADKEFTPTVKVKLRAGEKNPFETAVATENE